MIDYLEVCFPYSCLDASLFSELQIQYRQSHQAFDTPLEAFSLMNLKKHKTTAEESNLQIKNGKKSSRHQLHSHAQDNSLCLDQLGVRSTMVSQFHHCL